MRRYLVIGVMGWRDFDLYQDAVDFARREAAEGDAAIAGTKHRIPVITVTDYEEIEAEEAE